MHLTINLTDLPMLEVLNIKRGDPPFVSLWFTSIPMAAGSFTATSLNVSHQQARELRDALLEAFPIASPTDPARDEVNA